MMQRGTKSMRKLSLLTIAGAMALGVAACGGGSSGTTSSTTTTVSGDVSNAPINGAGVAVNGVSTGESSSSVGAYSTTLSGSQTYPLVISFDVSGATDTVTGETPTIAPSVILQADDVTTATSGDGTATANANTLTTMITDAATAAAGSTSAITSDQVSTVLVGLMNVFGAGLDSITNFDPRTTDLGSLSADELTQVAMAFEMATETIRRVVNSTGTSQADVLSNLATELSDGSLDGDGSATSAGIVNSVLLVGATVSTEVASGSFRITKANGTQMTAAETQSAIGTAFAGVNSNVTAATLQTNVADTTKFTGNAQFIAKAQGLLTRAVDITASSGGTTDFSGALTQFNTLAGGGTATVTTVTVSTSDLIAAKNDANAATTQTSANKNANKVTKFTVPLTYTDSSSATCGTSGTVSGLYITDAASSNSPLCPTTMPSLTSGVLTVSLPTSESINATNMSLLTSATTSSSATVPVMEFALSKIPVTSGTVRGVTLILVDGANTSRESGERYLKAVFDLTYASTSSGTLTFVAPSAATVTYYSASATVASTATLSQSAIGSLVATSTGTSSSQSSQQTTVQMRVAELFNTGSSHGNSALATAMTGVTSAGTYSYSISLGGFPLADTDGNDIGTITGTFTVAD